MYILLEACKTPAVLRTIYFGYLFWELLSVLIPVALIVLLIIDFSKAVVSSSEENQTKSMKMVLKRIMMAIIIFFVPYIVDLIMLTLSAAEVEIGSDYTECINTVKAIDEGADSFEVYEKAYEAEQEVERLRNQGKNNSSGGNNSGGGSSSKASSTAERLVTLIKGEIGNTDGTKYGSGHWCGYFTSWALRNTKMDNGQTIFEYLSANGSISPGDASGTWPAFRGGKNSNISFNKSKAYGGNYTPKPGDVIYFHWDNGYCRTNFGRWNGSTQCADHVGLVERVEGNTIYTIEGNTNGGMVASKTHQLDSDTVVAFGSWYK